MHLENVEIVHFIPGRVRLRSSELRGRPELAEHLRHRLSQVFGITAVEISEVTGSVLILYQAEHLAQEASLRDLKEIMVELFPNLNADEVLAWLVRAHQS